MKGNGRRLGFTTIELLVAALCVGLLFGIVQPSLQSSLGQSRNAVCLDRLRAIGQANLVYSDAELDGAALPVHRQQFQQDPSNPIFVGAYEWGGKSGVGRPDFLDPPDPLSSRYGTRAGFGPATRPLNAVLYPHGFRDNGDPTFNRRLAYIDTQLQLDAYRCPADDGPPDGGHCPEWIDHPKQSSFDHFGTSYAANLFMIASSTGGSPMYSNSPYLRPLSRVPNPARTLNYEENIGRWAWAARREIDGCEFVGLGVDPGPTKAIRGWHGRNWTYNRAFVDAHAGTQPVYIEGTEDAEGFANHYFSRELPAYPDFPGPPPSQGDYQQCRCIIVRGDGWQKDTMPAPLLQTGLLHDGNGRPSYEDCVTESETAAGGSAIGAQGAR